mmetsp:Transcript_418/g.1002  ORF Transcript_418/g.1002 Transcript_418/m.1002 type:complete len:905 (+) Transcript_418:594-3308(+)
MDRLMRHLQGTHKLVHRLDVPAGCAGRRGHGVAIIASNACAEFLSVFRIAPDIQCVWMKCQKELFGLNREVLIGAVYTNPQGRLFTVSQVREQFTHLFDELACAAQVTPDLLLCGDFNAKIGSLREVSDAHYETLVDCPALQTARRCECRDVNVAGRLLVDIAAAYGLVFTTGRVPGDFGQPTVVGYRSDTRPSRRSRPDHVLVSPSLFKCAQKSDICAPILDTTDHGSITVVFRIPDVVPNVDWTPSPEHVCGMGRCASRLSLTWKHERQLAYVEELERNLEMLVQLEAALDAGNIDTACFCLRSWIMQAASEQTVGMYRVQACVFKRTEKHGIKRPVWFDDQCRLKRRLFIQAVQSGQAVHACQFLKKEYKKQTRRARRAYEKYQKAVFLDRLKRHRPDIHEMLRKPRSTHQTPITADGWNSYLQHHFGARMNNCSSPSNREAAHMHGMGSCPESTHYQDAALHTNGFVGRHPTCPARNAPHIPDQQASPMGSCPESTLSRRPGMWDSISRGVESVIGAMRGVAQRVAARWTGNSGAPAWDMVVPLGRNNPPPEQLFRQGAESRWMPEPDVMELPDAAALYPIVCEHMGKLNARTSPGFDAVAAPFTKYAEKRVPAVNGGGTDRMNVLAPYIARLFAAMMERAEIPACWKVAKITPLYKKGSVLDPGNYRMLAVSGTLYRLYANVLREVVTGWCKDKNKIPDTQFGFYPGRNTLQPTFILRHLQHAAQVKRPNASPRLHAAFIDFKQAYDTIPREALWTHLQRIRMPACLLAVIKSMYANDEYILVDGCKRARVRPHFGVKQGCPLSPLLFSLYINDVDCLAENVQGAITGTRDVRVTHMLYADNLCLTSNLPDQLQLMLDRLHTYAQWKGLVINTAKSEIVHFNSKGDNVPVFTLGGARLA